MASLISHAVAALGIGTIFAKPGMPYRVWIIGVACSVIPDADVMGFRLGVHYGDFWGHRGFTHSLLFSAIIASLATIVGFLRRPPEVSRAVIWLYFFLAAASHGLLDALTNGGLGVAFFAPFDQSRYFFLWRPIEVSPISVTRFFGEPGLAVLHSEFIWIWTPAGLAAIAVGSARAFWRKSAAAR